MLPRDQWLTFSLSEIGQRRFRFITDLNLPGAVVGAPLYVPAASFLRQHPGVLSMRVWHTITIPFFCLPAWWFVGVGLDGLFARRRLHWTLLVSGSILSAACLARVIGLLTSPPADKADLLEFLPGAVFWTLAFGAVPLNWAFGRRREEKLNCRSGSGM